MAGISPSVRDWLLRGSDPSVRVRALTELFDAGPDDPQLRAARREIGRKGWAAIILREQLPEGHWVTRGTSARELYRPKYVALNWKLLVLSELGVSGSDRRVVRALRLFLKRFGGAAGSLGGRGSEVCFTGNAARLLLAFGRQDEPALVTSLDWLVRHQKNDGGWHCFRSSVGTLDGWEPMAAFALLPKGRRTPAIDRAVERGARFYLDRGLLREGRGLYAPWTRLHYPRHYYYDYLVGLEFLTALGYGDDRRLAPALDRLESRRRADGTWPLDALQPDLDDPNYPFRNPYYAFGLELVGHPSRFVTVSALSVLRRAGRI